MRRSALALVLALAAGHAHALVWPDVPDQVERGLQSSNPQQRRAAALDLGKLGAKRAGPLLAKALGDPDVEVRLAAADAAVKLRYAATHDAVASWLGERDIRLRIKACDVARELPDPRVIPQIGRALGDPEADVREHAAEALGAQAPDDAAPPLLGKIDDPTPKVRVAIARALARLGDKRAVVPLVGKVQDSVPDVRREVARALGDLGDARASQALMLQLRDNIAEVRVEALGALGRLRAPDAVDAIAALLSDRTPNIRPAAMAALGNIASKEAIKALVQQLGFGPDDAGGTLERTTVRAALVSAGSGAIADLGAVLKSPPSTSAAISAAWILGQLEAKSEAPTVVAAMRRGALPTAAGLRALAGAGSNETVPVVLEFVSDSSPAVRAEALRAAAALLDPAHPDGRAVEPLAAALRDPRLTVHERAEVAKLLGRTGAPRAAPLLVALVKAKDTALRLAAIDGLGLLGPAGADDALLEALAESDPTVRLRAAIALGECGSAKARDALVANLDASEELDRAAVLTALAGVLAREPSDATVARLEKQLDIAVGAERDALIVAIGRAKTPKALEVMTAMSRSEVREDRASAASALAAREAQAAPLLRALLADREAMVRAQAAWALGRAGDASDLARLEALARGADLDLAANATAALGMITGRASEASRKPFVDKLCALESDARPLVRANAMGAIGLASARCGDAERRALSSDASEIVRAAAARVLARSPSPDDRRALDQCAAVDRAGSVARVCRDRPPAPKKTHATLVYVVPDGANTPKPGAPYALVNALGMVRAGATDRRGALFEAFAPEGELALVRGGEDPWK